MKRWHAIVTYVSDKLNFVDVEYDFEELNELQNIIEHGPDWNAIEVIRIQLQRSTGRLTLEQSNNV